MWPVPTSWQPPLITAILSVVGGVILEKYRSRRPNLVYYLSHISDFRISTQPQQGQSQQPQQVFINTHSITVANIGRGVAHNVEVAHRPIIDPNFWWRINPDVPVEQGRTPEGGLILRFPLLHPNQQVLISYLYTYPHRIELIHNYVRSAEVPGVAINVISVRPWPRWMQLAVMWLALFGLLYVGQLLVASLINVVRRVVASG